MATNVLRSVRLPTDEEARLAAESSRLLAACVGTGERARLRLIDGDADVTAYKERIDRSGREAADRLTAEA